MDPNATRVSFVETRKYAPEVEKYRKGCALSIGEEKANGVDQKRRLGDFSKINDAAYAAFERHNTGFASRMMAKWGFKGRLGKKEDGILEPIQPRSGLGHGNGDEWSRKRKQRPNAKEHVKKRVHSPKFIHDRATRAKEDYDPSQINSKVELTTC